ASDRVVQSRQQLGELVLPPHEHALAASLCSGRRPPVHAAHSRGVRNTATGIAVDIWRPRPDQTAYMDGLREPQTRLPPVLMPGWAAGTPRPDTASPAARRIKRSAITPGCTVTVRDSDRHAVSRRFLRSLAAVTHG